MGITFLIPNGERVTLIKRKSIPEKRNLAVPELAEVSAGTNASANEKASSFPALRNRNYRLFFFGQFVSVIGTWMQIVAQGWPVLQLTTSPTTIGFIAAMATAPSLLFSLFGGVIVDQNNKKRVLYFTQIANFTLALILGILTILNLVTLPVLAVIAFALGTVNAIDAPARQSFVSQIVNKDQLASAIALNSAIFNAARAVGPAVSGLLIAYVGTGAAFLCNAISYVGLFVALTFIPFEEKRNIVPGNPLRAIKDGVQYTFDHPLIRVLIIFTGVLSVFGWSYSTLMPLIAKTTFGLDAQGLGYLYAATGLGSVLATYVVGAHSKRFSPVVLVTVGNIIFAISLVCFAFTKTLPAAMPFLFFIGMGLLLQASTMNTLIQSVVKNQFRGRVMSLYVLMFLGFAPLGNFEVGLLSERISIPYTLAINAVIVLAFGLLVFAFRNRIRDAYRVYHQSGQS
jgi:predicted MFS family arabinose efflux permease